MNIIINAHSSSIPRSAEPSETPVIGAICLRVRDAAAAYGRAIERGAWAVPARIAVMELNIPAIHGVGSSRIYFVDRYRNFSIGRCRCRGRCGCAGIPPAVDTGLRSHKLDSARERT